MVSKAGERVWPVHHGARELTAGVSLIASKQVIFSEYLFIRAERTCDSIAEGSLRTNQGGHVIMIAGRVTNEMNHSSELVR